MRNKPIKINRPCERRRNWSKMEVAPLWVLGGFAWFDQEKMVLGRLAVYFYLFYILRFDFQRGKHHSFYLYLILHQYAILLLPLPTDLLFSFWIIWWIVSFCLKLETVSVVLVFINNSEQPSLLNNGTESFCF